MPLYIKRQRRSEISPLYNGEVNASVYKETEISPLYNGELNASVYKEIEISTDIRLKSRRCTTAN